jgi:hypothetical protein
MNGALKSALTMSTFKTSGKQVFISDSSGKRKRASVSIASTSSTASRARLVNNPSTQASTSSASRTRLVEDPSSQAQLKIVDGRRWSPGIYRTLRLLGKTLNAAWEGAFV